MQKPTFDPGLTQTFTGSIRRTINKDGSFNVRRAGRRWRDAGPFLYFMQLSWPAFLVQVPLVYLAIETLFALLYWAIGVEHLQGAASSSPLDAFLNAFFFSVQTFTTVGYGHIAPTGFLSSSLAAVEAMSGILSLAIATGLIYARFSRPSARLAFSDHALIVPYQNASAFMFRVANRRPNILMDLEATVLLMTVDASTNPPRRKFSQLELERPNVYFLPLSWTLVHPIDEKSPLRGLGADELKAAQAEFLIVIRCFDDTFSQTVHARHSYTYDELVCQARFDPAFHANSDGDLVLDLSRLDSHTLLQ